MDSRCTTLDLSRTYGGTAMRFAPQKADPAYPQSAEWARAGVRGGVPDSIEIKASVEPGATAAQIQRAIDQVAMDGGGGVLLAAGRHVLEEPLAMRSGVVLRGAYIDQTIVEFRLRGTFPGFKGHEIPEREKAIVFENVERAGLEYLTVLYDQTLPRIWTVRHGDKGFVDNPNGMDDLFVIAVGFERSADCWVQACRIVDSGSNPIDIVRSRHITVRHCEVMGAHNRGGGQGYLHICRSESCLLANLLVSDLRHLTIQTFEEGHPCRHNVVIDCDLAVDVNFHCADSGSNLVQDCRVHIPSHHWWGPFALGAPNMHQPPGPQNLVYRCDAVRWQLPGVVRSRVADDPSRVYVIAADWERPAVRDFGPAPSTGTLYPVEASPA